MSENAMAVPKDNRVPTYQMFLDDFSQQIERVRHINARLNDVLAPVLAGDPATEKYDDSPETDARTEQERLFKNAVESMHRQLNNLTDTIDRIRL